LFPAGVAKGARLWPVIAETVAKVGQLQLLRRQIAQELRFSCTFDSQFLARTLDTLNQALMTDVQAHYADPTKPYPSAG
jgi:WASH complex subunit strumpellin